jgi:hypothetical protein
MVEFFMDGGWSMYPVLIVGLVLLGSAAYFAVDREPVRLRFVSVLSLALLAFSAQGLVVDVATVCWALSDEKRVPAALRVPVLLEGLKESTRPLTLGLGLLALALILVSIGVYRSGRREIQAAAH